MEELGFTDIGEDLVEFPEVRKQVLRSLRSLSDFNHQEKVWRDGEWEPSDTRDDLTLVVNILFDDTRVLEDPEGRIGLVLVSGREVEALQRLADLLDPLIDRLGESPDVTYMASPEWPEVVKAAKKAMTIMIHPDSSG